MFDIFKDSLDGMVARARLVARIEKKTGIGPIGMRDTMIDAFHTVCERHDLIDEFNEELWSRIKESC